MKSRILKKLRPAWKAILSFVRRYYPKTRVEGLWNILKRKPLFWAGLSIAVGLVLFAILKSILTVPQGEFAVVEKGDFYVDMVEAGDIQALSERRISAPETRLEQIQVIKLVPEGTMVKQGDFLAQMDAGDLETQESLAEDRLAVARANYQKVLAQQALTMHSYENNLKLYEYNYEQAQLSLQAQQYESEIKKEEARLQLKQAEINLNRVKRQIESQKIIQANERVQNEATISQVRNEIRSLKEQIAKMIIRAPTDGMVIYQEVGSWQSRERLKEGYKARHGEPILSIPDLSRLQVSLYVNEVDRSQVQSGEPVQITLDAYPKTVFSGTVKSVSRLAQNVRGNSKLKGFVLLVDIRESDIRIKPGMSAKARIILATLKDVLTVPTGVVFEVDGKPAVFRLGKTKPTFVTLGPRNDSRIVIEKGLKRGMKLAWHPESADRDVFGTVEEKKRIALAAANLEQSMSLFEKKGTLYDYVNPNRMRRSMRPSGTPGEEGMQNMLKQYLQRQGGQGQPGGVDITPEMMDRIRSRHGRTGGDSTGGRQGMGGQYRRGQIEGRTQGAETVNTPHSEDAPERTERPQTMRQGRAGTDVRQEEREMSAPEAGAQEGRTGDRGQRRFFRGDSSAGRGRREMTPEMRERIRQWREKREAGDQGGDFPGPRDRESRPGGASGDGTQPRFMRGDSAGSRPFERFPEMHDRRRQQDSDTSSGSFDFRRGAPEPAVGDSSAYQRPRQE